MYNGPVRDGARGGRDQFNWESVKADKDREYYLGHSVKATVGRWQKVKDPYWYTKGKNGKGSELSDEIKAVQSRENDIMLEALGIKKKPKSTNSNSQGFGSKLEAHEVQELLRREEGEENVVEAQRGLGFRHGAMGGIEKCERLDGFGITEDIENVDNDTNDIGRKSDKYEYEGKIKKNKRDKEKHKGEKVKGIKKNKKVNSDKDKRHKRRHNKERF